MSNDIRDVSNNAVTTVIIEKKAFEKALTDSDDRMESIIKLIGWKEETIEDESFYIMTIITTSAVQTLSNVDQKYELEPFINSIPDDKKIVVNELW